MSNMSSSRGDGNIPVELGTIKLDTFAQDIFRKTPQNLSYVRKVTELVFNRDSLNPPNVVNFKVPGKHKQVDASMRLRLTATRFCSSLAYANYVYFLDKIQIELHLRMIESETRAPPFDGCQVGEKDTLNAPCTVYTIIFFQHPATISSTV